MTFDGPVMPWRSRVEKKVLLALIVLLDVHQVVVRLPPAEERGDRRGPRPAARARRGCRPHGPQDPSQGLVFPRKVSTGCPGGTVSAGSICTSTSRVTREWRSHMDWISLYGHAFGEGFSVPWRRSRCSPSPGPTRAAGSFTCSGANPACRWRMTSFSARMRCALLSMTSLMAVLIRAYAAA